MSKARYHEHAGEERHLHGLHHSKYDTLSHHHDAHAGLSEKSGSYHYDRERDNMRGMYEGFHGRRHQEMKDAGMIHEDHNAIANLPQNVMIKHYGDSYGYTPEDLNDTIEGVDRQIGYDNRQKMTHFFPKKV